MTTLAHEILSVSTPLQEGETMTLKELCNADREKNYSGNEPSGDVVFSALPHLIASGHRLFRAGNSMWVGLPLPNNGLEFHTCNAERGQDLVKNTISFFDLLKSTGIGYAVTYYDFPKITTLLSTVGRPVTIHQVDEGKHRTFRAKVSV